MLVLRTRPPVIPPNLVARPRLSDALTVAVKLPFTLVSAGPGTGKTLAVATWARNDTGGVPVAWLSLDDTHNEPRVFWSEVLFALTASGGVPAGNPLRDLIPAAGFGPADARQVIELLADLPVPVVLVLDDFQEITGAAVQRSVQRLVKAQPPTLRLVVLSRADPVLPLHRLRVNAELTEIRARDLAFTEREAAELFAASGIGLGTDQVGALHRRTEGWAVGLRLAAMSLDPDDPDDLAAGVDRFSGTERSVAEYLVGEVTARLGRRQRDFLLRTSVVDQLSGDLADHLTGRRDGQQVLERLVRDNALVVGFGGHGDWFSYHPLLRELLRNRLHVEHPGAAADLHRSAADWMTAHGEPVQAIRQSLLAGDPDGAGRTLLTVIPRILSPDGPALLAAIEPLARAADGRPTLSSLLASASVHLHRLDAAALHRDAVEARGFLGQADEPTRAPAEAAILMFDMAAARISGDTPAVLAIGARALELLDHTPRQLLPTGRQYRIITMNDLGAAQLWAGFFDDAEEMLTAAIPQTLEMGLLLPHLDAAGHLALLDAFKGHHRRAHHRAGQALRIIERRGWAAEPQALPTFLALTQLALARHDPDTAGRYLRKGLAGSGRHTDRADRLALGITAVQVAISRGAAGAALAADARAAAGLTRTPRAADLLTRWSNITGAEALLLAGQPAAAIHRIGEPNNGDDFAAGWERIMLGRARLTMGDPAAARTLIEPLLSPGYPYREPAIAAHLQHTLIADRHHQDSIASLSTAIDLAHPEGIKRPFLHIGGRLPELLTTYQQRGAPHQTFTAELRDLLPPHPDPTGPVMIEHLTGRERDILQYLPTMFKANEIAAELYVSVNTVKAHLRSMYRKLGAGNRREAVERAKTLGLL
jgi:LuxR family maltose regulon positive regulatory protein